ncbi:MAG: DHH family phosphoesterase [Flavonifractor plautii]
MDHNELSQTVPGIDQAEILGIIDHHRLADIQTRQPITVRNEPVGSTNTIITSMYQEHGVTPSPHMAGLMAAAILSDTVMFKSPTCTKRDIAMAERLARIARGIPQRSGRELFSGSNDSRSAGGVLRSDFKEFHISGAGAGRGAGHLHRLPEADGAQGRAAGRHAPRRRPIATTW